MTNPPIDAAATTYDQPPVLAMDDRAFAGHPRGLGLLFFVEMWERFSYYGMRALLVLYLVNALKWPRADASLLYGAYTGSVYLTPLLGGWLADRFLGTRRSLVVGGIIIALGHFLLAFGPGAVADGGASPDGSAMAIFYLGLVLVVVGTGFFKPNVSTMVGQLYRPGDSRRDAGFTIFYMGINLGAFIAPLACGWLGEKIGWHYGFGAAGIGMLLGLALYLLKRDHFLPGIGLAPPNREDAPLATAAEALASPVPAGGSLIPALGGAGVGGLLALSAAYGNLTLSNILGVLMAAAAGAAISTAFFGTRGDERRRMIALIIVVVFATFFWLAFEQAGSSMTLFADKNTDRHFGSGTFPASWFQSVQPLSIILLAPVMAWLWNALARRGSEPSTSVKMVFGLALVGAGFLFLVIAGGPADRGVLVSPFWLVAAYVAHSLGELCLSPVGLSYFTKVAPARFTSLMMGVWFLALGAANYLGGFLASKMDVVSSLPRFFMIPVATSFGAALVMLMLVPVLKRLTATVADA
ncbi:MAG: peptide MFS transporter [Gemmatimonadaceae bacterium]|nr:peptide MFS transporter [Gemmatimonadaceae bacterium]